MTRGRHRARALAALAATLAGATAVAAALALLPWLAGGCARAPRGPNIVLVVLDTVRRDYTGAGAGAAGGQAAAAAAAGEQGTAAAAAAASYTPALDALAAEGTCYTQAWANAPWTAPSHASIFTGLLPSEHGCATAEPRLLTPRPTLAELLGKAGYRTAAFYSNPWLSDRITNLLRGFGERFETPIGSLHEMVSPTGDQGGRQVLGSVQRWLSAYDRKRPCFLFVNFLEAHLPYDPPADYRRAHLADLPPDDRVSIQWAHECSAGLHPPQIVDWDRVRRLYGGDVNTADRLLEGLIRLLRSSGLYDDCVLIVTSDHGENLGDHGLVEHQFSVHESLLAVPLAVRAPVLARQGRGVPAGRVDRPVELVDLFPTILDAAGVAPPSPAPSHARSLLAAPGGAGGTAGAADRLRPLVAEYDGPGPGLLRLLQGFNPQADLTGRGAALRTVRSGDWRLTVSSDGQRWLHHIPSDPGQDHDVAAREPRVVAGLASLLERETGRAPLAPAGAMQVDEATRQRLRALGYVR